MKMTIGAKIQALRKQRGMSQEQLAEALGVSRQAVSKWEAEQSVPDIDKIIAICDYFSVTTDYIIRDADLPKTEQPSEPQSEPIADDYYTSDIIETDGKDKTEESRKKSALLLAIPIMMYILSIVPPIVFENTLGVVLMFVMIAVATGLIVYRATINSKNKNIEEHKEPKNPALKAAKNCVWAVALVVYFLISFASSAWHITWLVFPIAGAISDVVAACFDLKDGDDK